MRHMDKTPPQPGPQAVRVPDRAGGVICRNHFLNRYKSFQSPVSNPSVPRSTETKISCNFATIAARFDTSSLRNNLFKT